VNYKRIDFMTATLTMKYLTIRQLTL
jgi:hypothetical protein